MKYLRFSALHNVQGSWSFNVVQYYSAGYLKEGENVYFQREPRNIYDPNSINVYSVDELSMAKGSL
jgi:hypothetical protein